MKEIYAVQGLVEGIELVRETRMVRRHLMRKKIEKDHVLSGLERREHCAFGIPEVLVVNGIEAVLDSRERVVNFCAEHFALVRIKQKQGVDLAREKAKQRFFGQLKAHEGAAFLAGQMEELAGLVPYPVVDRGSMSSAATGLPI